VLVSAAANRRLLVGQIMLGWIVHGGCLLMGNPSSCKRIMRKPLSLPKACAKWAKVSSLPPERTKISVQASERRNEAVESEQL